MSCSFQLQKCHYLLQNHVLGTFQYAFLLFPIWISSIELLQNRDIWQRVLEAESTRSKPELLELLRNVLDPEKHLIPAITDRDCGIFP